MPEVEVLVLLSFVFIDFLKMALLCCNVWGFLRFADSASQYIYLSN